MAYFFKPKRERLLSDELPYLTEEGAKSILHLKDGAFTKSFLISPKNLISSTDEDLEFLKAGLSHSLGELPEGSLIQILFVRQKSNPRTDEAIRNWENSHNQKEGDSDLFLAKRNLIESQIKRDELYETKILITLRVPNEFKINTFSKLSPLSFLRISEKNQAGKSNESVQEELEKTVYSFREKLNDLGFETSDLSSKEKIKFLFEYFNPKRSFPESFNVETSDLSNAITLTDLVESKSGVSLGNTRLRIGTLKNLPESSAPGILGHFSSKTNSFILTTTILVLSQTEEKEKLSRRQRLATGMAGGNAVRNLSAEAQLLDIEQTLTSMIETGEKLFATSFHLTFFEKDENSLFLSELADAERIGAGCRWFEETVGAYPVFFGILPFAPQFLVRPKRVLSSVLSDLLPVYGIGAGHSNAEVLFETPYQSAIGFSLFEKSPSGNGLLIGSTGTGKSTLACGLILGMLAQNPNAETKVGGAA